MMVRRKLVLIGLNLAGAALIVFGGALTTIPRALAGQTSYTETWTAAKFRTIRVGQNYSGGFGELAIGPSEWAVTGSQGSTSWQESWRVAKWSSECDSLFWICIGNRPLFAGSYYYGESTTPNVAPVNGIAAGAQYGNITTWAPSGLYGWIKVAKSQQASQQGGGYVFSQATDVAGGASWPLSWTVTGTISN